MTPRQGIDVGRNRSHQTWLLRFALAACFATASAVTLSWPPWGDEGHFLETVRLFGQGITLDLLRTYPELTPPLAFVTYAVWGHLVGFETWTLRLLSPLLAWATAALLAHVLCLRGVNSSIVVLGTLLIAVNPYFIGLSAFVFTDMLALMMLIVATLGIVRDRPWITGVGIAGAVLTRQYLVFLTLAVLVAALAAGGPTRMWRNRHVAAALVAVVPLFGLILLWYGPSPVSPLRTRYVAEEGLSFNPNAFSLYLAAPGLYLAPLLAWKWRDGVRRASFAAGLLIALTTTVFPIQATAAQLMDNIATVGFAHRALAAIAPPPVAALIWFAAAAAWLVTLADCARERWSAWSQRGVGLADAFVWAGILAFMAVMPFSFSAWEKYALPLLIFGVLALCTCQRNASAES